MKKIVIYGAGRVGTTAALNLMRVKAQCKADIVLYAPHNHKRCEGALMDMEDACAMQNITPSFAFKATSDVADLADADAMVVCSGGLSSREMYEDAAQKGIDDRLVQAVYNIDLMKQFAEVAKLSPHAIIFVLTNPVDLMCEVLRGLLPEHQVYGLGCWLDTARFKRELLPLLGKEFPHLQLSDIEASIIGHHNGTMFLHENSLTIDGLPYRFANRVEAAMKQTRGRGLAITETNVQATDQTANNGSYYGPARMVSDVIEAFICGRLSSGRFILPMNRQIYAIENAELAGKYAQMPCAIMRKSVVAVETKLSTSDVANMKHCFDVYDKDKEKLKAYMQE